MGSSWVKPRTIYSMHDGERIPLLWALRGKRARVVYSPLRQRACEVVIDGVVVTVALSFGRRPAMLVVQPFGRAMPFAFSVAAVRHVELLPEEIPAELCEAPGANGEPCRTPLFVNGTCPLANDHSS